MEKILSDLKQGKISPCYLLYGEEEYLINEYLTKMLDILVPDTDRDFCLFLLDGEEVVMDELLGMLETPSLLGTRKVIVVKNASFFSSRQNIDDIIEKIISHLDEHPTKAVKHFQLFLRIAGLSFEDLQHGGWEKISEEQWRDLTGSATGFLEREKWLPRILDLYGTTSFPHNATTNPEEKEERVVRTAAATGNCVIFTATSVDKRKKLYKIIADAKAAIYFGKPPTATMQKDRLTQETQALLKKSNKRMSSDAWMALGRKTGWELRRSVTELEKLILFTGNREVIEQTDVDEVVGKTKEDSIFDLTSALGQKNVTAALVALQTLLAQGEPPLRILSMLAREVRLLLQARILIDQNILPHSKPQAEYGWFQKTIYPTLVARKPEIHAFPDSLFNQHPYTIYHAWKNGGSFRVAELTDLFHTMLRIDVRLKSSTQDAQMLLEQFLIRACSAN